MKNNLFTSRFQQKWLKTKLLPLACLGFLFICLGMVKPSSVLAQADSIHIYSDTSTICASPATCCMRFSLFVNRTGTRWFKVKLTAAQYSDYKCLDITCALQTLFTNDNYDSGPHNDLIVVDTSIKNEITFNVIVSDDSTNGWTAGTYLYFTLCHKAGADVHCENQWNPSSWWSYDDLYPNNKNPKDHNAGYDTTNTAWCGSPTPCSPACDVIEKSSRNGYELFCVTRHDWPKEADSIVVTIKPPLDKSCAYFTGDTLRKMHCCDTIWQRVDTGLVPWVIPCNGGSSSYPCAGTPRDTIIHMWDTTGVHTADSDVYTFKPSTDYYKLAPCGIWCLKIKKCSGLHTVKIQTYPLGDTSGTCGTDTISATFKKGHSAEFIMTEDNLDEQNYPNPLSWDNNFRTTIPFVLSSGGDADIKISDETGSVIRKETMTFSDGGRHFFYFTATDLPTGKYFYQIESPKGNIIVSKKMIVIK